MKTPSQLSFLDLFPKPTLEGLLKPEQIFESTDFELFTRLTEDDRFDRKSSKIDPRSLAEYVSAFGNGPSVAGGVLAIGIGNDRQIEGCKHLSERQLQEIEDLGMNRCPGGRFRTRRLPVINRHGEHDFIILVRIYYVEDRLVELTDGKAYARIGHKCKLLNDVQKSEFRFNKRERSFEAESSPLRYPDEFRTDEINRFCKMLRERREASEEVMNEQILEIMHMGKRFEDTFIPNNACTILFGKDPQSEFPGCYVHFLRYSGTEERSGRDYNVVKDRMISGSVFEILKNTSSVIDANLREFTEFRDGKFYSMQEYPRDAWYELLVNACVHRSYHIRNAPIFVKMFDDRFVVESPGGFMPDVTPENIYEMHRPRNPFMMFVLREYGEVRCVNEGTKRVRKEMRDANLPAPEFYQETQSGTAVRAVLRNNIRSRTNTLDSEAYKILGEAIALSLDPEERKIVNYVIENGRINVSEALRLLKTTYWHTAKNKLKRLVARGILDHVSVKMRDPNAHYVLRMTQNGTKPEKYS